MTFKNFFLKPPTESLIHIQTAHAPLTDAQRQFNDLIQQIEAHKTQLADWQTTLDECQQVIAGKITPVRLEYGAVQTQLVHLMENKLLAERFTPLQEEKIRAIMLLICRELLSLGEFPEAQAVYQRYSPTPESASKTHEHASYPYDEPKNATILEEDIENIAEQFEREQQAAEARRAHYKKTAKQQVKAEREADHDAQMSQSLRAVYRELVAALHPDREPDEGERERKTALMQQITVAYKNKDLLKLLELQLAVEQIDPAKLSAMAEERLAHYNYVLTKQLNQLKAELNELQQRLMRHYDLTDFVNATPERVLHLLHQEVITLKQQIKALNFALHDYEDTKTFKAWINDYHLV